MIRFAVPVAKVDKNFQDLSWYDVKEPRFKHLNIWYDGADFIIENTHLLEGQKKPRKVFVAKTNISQWEFDDTERESTVKGSPEKVSAKAKS